MQVCRLNSSRDQWPPQSNGGWGGQIGNFNSSPLKTLHNNYSTITIRSQLAVLRLTLVFISSSSFFFFATTTYFVLTGHSIWLQLRLRSSISNTNRKPRWNPRSSSVSNEGGSFSKNCSQAIDYGVHPKTNDPLRKQLTFIVMVAIFIYAGISLYR